jgi:murein DD-endopeptidase MepM/ murein hydrolase activator NlpD
MMKKKRLHLFFGFKAIYLIGALLCFVFLSLSFDLIRQDDVMSDIHLGLNEDSQLNSTNVLPKFLNENMVGNYVRIESSFLKSALDAGIPNKISYQAAEIFESLIDFSREIHQGDEFFVIYEVELSADNTVKPSKIIAAEMVNRGRSFKAVLHTAQDGRDIYLTPEGKSLELAFLKSPIKFSKVSSEFSKSRFHPILKKVRSHKGIDYSAAAGTEVRAVADGRIHYLGYNGGYGKLITIKHANSKETRYGHLSAYSKNIKLGGRVTKGQVIGYVGMTGLATAPHLHFEFIDNGQHLNPRKMPRESTIVLNEDQSNGFVSHVSEKIQMLDQIKIISSI